MPRRSLTPWQEFWSDIFYGRHDPYTLPWCVQRLPAAIVAGAVLVLWWFVGRLWS